MLQLLLAPRRLLLQLQPLSPPSLRVTFYQAWRVRWYRANRNNNFIEPTSASLTPHQQPCRAPAPRQKKRPSTPVASACLLPRFHAAAVPHDAGRRLSTATIPVRARTANPTRRPQEKNPSRTPDAGTHHRAVYYKRRPHESSRQKAPTTTWAAPITRDVSSQESIGADPAHGESVKLTHLVALER